MQTNHFFLGFKKRRLENEGFKFELQHIPPLSFVVILENTLTEKYHHQFKNNP